MKKKTILAVFDIDGTIFRSSLLIELNKKLVERGVFPKKATEEILANYFAWRNRQGSYGEYLKRVIEMHIKYLRGTLEKDVFSVERAVVEEGKHRVYVYTRELIKNIAPTHHLLAISGSPVDMIQEFVSAYGFDACRGAVYEVKNGVFTGEVLYQPSSDKKTALLDYVSETGFSLEGSMGVGDTESDIAFLEIVEHPICFNPNRALYEEAKKRGWKIVAERKDVVYEL